MEKHIHHAIPGQTSSYINETYPLFVDFLKGYYEWLETEGSPYHMLRNHLSYLDFKESITAYTDLLKFEYLEGIPEKVIADKEILIKHSKDFFGSIGTEKSFEFLFKILYGENVEIYYPADDILRGSDGTWTSGETVMYISDGGNVDSFTYRRIMQKREVFSGIFEYAYATVNRVVKRYARGFVFAEMYLSDISGSFDEDYPITLADVESGPEEWIMPICSSVKIIDSGEGYLPGNSLTYDGPDEFVLSLTATEIGRINTRYTTNINQNDLDVTMNGHPLEGFAYDGRTISHPSIVPGNTFTIAYKPYHGLLTISSVGELGDVRSIEITDIPFGLEEGQHFLGLEGGNGLIAEVERSITRPVDGYFANNNGFLSDRKVLQDSDYYQDFSYVIKSGISIDQYKDVVLQVLHPAGMKMFGEVNIIELINLMIRDASLDIRFTTLDVVFDMAAVALYNRTGFIDDWKSKFGPSLYSVANFDGMLVSDVTDFPDESRNIHDAVITINTDYFGKGYLKDPSEYVNNKEKP